MSVKKTDTPDALIRRADRNYRGFPDFGAFAATPLDASPWQSSLDSFNDARREASPESLRRALDFAMRAAAIDTGAIEGLYQVDRGFTFSVAAQTEMWELRLEEKGAHVRRLVESQLEGLELVVDAVTGKTEITESWIRQLHSVLCASQDTYRVRTAAGWQDQALPKGRYKQHANHPLLPDGRVHSYCPVEQTSSEMHRLVSELRGSGFADAHPVLQASYAHDAFVCVHPFADGNGRVARALASVFTYRACSIPLVVFADQKVRYLDALAGADAGHFERFASFVLSAGVDTMNLVIAQLREANAGSVREAARRLDGLYESTATPSPRELDAIAARVAGIARDVFARVLAETTMPAAISHEVAVDHYQPTIRASERSREAWRASACRLLRRRPTPSASRSSIRWSWPGSPAGSTRSRSSSRGNARTSRFVLGSISSIPP